MQYNKIMIAGNLTRDPEIKYLTNDNAVCNFGLASNRKYRSGGEQREEVTFVDVAAFGKTAELCQQYLNKGSGAFIEGRLKLDTWEDREGNKRSKLSVVAERVQFVGGSGEDRGGERQAQERPAPAVPPAADVDDEPPF